MPHDNEDGDDDEDEDDDDDDDEIQAKRDPGSVKRAHTTAVNEQRAPLPSTGTPVREMP